jgi:transcriptional regulator with GAF, ATPase, and Fis domain
MVEQIYSTINKELFGISLSFTTIAHFRQSFFRTRYRTTMANTFVHRHVVPDETPTLTTVDTSPLMSLLSHQKKVFTKHDPGWKIRNRSKVEIHKSIAASIESDVKVYDALRKGNCKITSLSNSAKDIQKFIQMTHAPLVADAALIDAHYSGRPRLIMPANNS